MKHKFTWSFSSDRIQWSFLGQTATSSYDVFPIFRELTTPPSSGCAGSLVAQKLMTRCLTLRPVSPFSRLGDGLVTPLVSGRSQKVIALCLFCVFLVVKSVSLNWLPAAMYDLIWGQPPYWSFQHVVEFLLLLSQLNPLTTWFAFHPATGQTDIYTVHSWTPSHQFWCYPTTSTPWRWEQS